MKNGERKRWKNEQRELSSQTILVRDAFDCGVFLQSYTVIRTRLRTRHQSKKSRLMTSSSSSRGKRERERRKEERKRSKHEKEKLARKISAQIPIEERSDRASEIRIDRYHIASLSLEQLKNAGWLRRPLFRARKHTHKRTFIRARIHCISTW